MGAQAILRRHQALFTIALGMATAVLVASLAVNFNSQTVLPIAKDDGRARILLWILLACANAMFGALGLVYLVTSWWNLRKEIEPAFVAADRRALLVDVLGTAALLGPAVWVALATHSSGFGAELSIPEGPDMHWYPMLGLPSFCVTLAFTLAMVYVSGSLRATFPDDIAQPAEKAGLEPGQKLKTFLLLQTHLNSYVTGAGLMMGLGCVGAAALANTGAFRRAYVIDYGVAYSLCLLLVYAALRFRFQKVGRLLRNDLNPFPERVQSDWDVKAWVEKGGALDSLLQLGFTGPSSLGPALAALIPVLVGILTALLKTN